MRAPNTTTGQWHPDTGRNGGVVSADVTIANIPDDAHAWKANTKLISQAPTAMQLLDALYEEARVADENESMNDMISIIQLIIKRAPVILERAGYTEEDAS